MIQIQNELNIDVGATTVTLWRVFYSAATPQAEQDWLHFIRALETLCKQQRWFLECEDERLEVLTQAIASPQAGDP